MTEAKKLIVNADDFGFSTGINDGILKCHKDGILTSTTIAANMPAAEEAAEKSKDFPDLGTGIHLNIVRGCPLTDKTKVNDLVDSNGHFRLSHKDFALLSLYKNNKIIKQIDYEYRAQIERALSLGLKISHIDSERHHAVWPAVFNIVLKLAEEYQIRGLRLINEPFLPTGLSSGITNIVKTCSLRILSKINKRSIDNFITTDYFYGSTHIGKINENFILSLLDCLPVGICELMTHPGIICGNESAEAASYLDKSRNIELEALCSKSVTAKVSKMNIELINFCTYSTDHL
ncbi:MAG: carbohydrate deacetylase [Planctomycetota bacterium]